MPHLDLSRPMMRFFEKRLDGCCASPLNSRVQVQLNKKSEAGFYLLLASSLFLKLLRCAVPNKRWEYIELRLIVGGYSYVRSLVVFKFKNISYPLDVRRSISAFLQ